MVDKAAIAYFNIALVPGLFVKATVNDPTSIFY